MRTRTLTVPALARIEGEGGLRVKVRDGKVTGVELNVFEPPRFFEALLRGRRFDEVPDIVARICGICPVAHQLTSIYALERGLNVQLEPGLHALRRLIYLGEWIGSHALHIYLLHAPDFLGAQDVLQLAAAHGEIVERALRLKRTGNDLVALVGGREIHPVNLKVGGFYRLPEPKALAAMRAELAWARDAALETVRWTATLPFPVFEQEYESVSVREAGNYPLIDGRVVSSGGLDVAVTDYEEQFEEEHVEHSNALQSSLKHRLPYLVGPLARFNLNYDRLGATARAAADEVGLMPGCRNPFRSIVIRAIELVQACEDALAITEHWEAPRAASVPVTGRAARGAAVSEAPRGMLYHRYTTDSRGIILDAKIVPPTSQNLKMMERDVGAFVATRLEMPEDQLTWQCEQAIRNYDPCISCATHFLTLIIESEGPNRALNSGR